MLSQEEYEVLQKLHSGEIQCLVELSPAASSIARILAKKGMLAIFIDDSFCLSDCAASALAEFESHRLQQSKNEAIQEHRPGNSQKSGNENTWAKILIPALISIFGVVLSAVLARYPRAIDWLVGALKGLIE